MLLHENNNYMKLLLSLYNQLTLLPRIYVFNLPALCAEGPKKLKTGRLARRLPVLFDCGFGEAVDALWFT